MSSGGAGRRLKLSLCAFLPTERTDLAYAVPDARFQRPASLAWKSELRAIAQGEERKGRKGGEEGEKGSDCLPSTRWHDMRSEVSGCTTCRKTVEEVRTGTDCHTVLPISHLICLSIGGSPPLGWARATVRQNVAQQPGRSKQKTGFHAT